MKKKILITIFIILLFLIVFVVFYVKKNINRDNEKINSELNSVQFTKLEDILTNYEYFNESIFERDSSNDKLVIDDKYEVYIKNGFYMMNIGLNEDENVYCNIVDAIEVSLGADYGSSIDTCMITLEGKINLGGINTTIYDDYKILTVNSETLASLYNESNNHKNGEYISREKINYAVNFSDFIISSIVYDEVNKNFCGNIHNNKNKNDDLVFKFYDKNKVELGVIDYNYINETNKYVSFCLNIEDYYDNFTYYMVDFK